MLSVTDLMTCEFCPRKLFLSKVLSWKVPEKDVMVRGTAIHKVFEETVKCERELVLAIREGMDCEMIQKEYLLAYVDAAKQAILSQAERLGRFNISPEEILESVRAVLEQEAEIRANNTITTIESNHVFGEDLWRIISPKIIPEKSISSDDMGLRGIVDRVEVHKDVVVPIEIKSGSSPREGAWPNHKLQLIAYSMLMKEEFPAVANYGFVRYLDADGARKIMFNPFMELEIKKLISQAKEITESTETPPHAKDKKKCAMCDFKKDCFDERFVIEEVARVKGAH